MAKRAVSVTLDEANVLWLKGRARISGGNVSETLDQLISKARGDRARSGPFPSVVGTIDLLDDPGLLGADEGIRAWFAESLARPLVGTEDRPLRPRRARKKKARG
jgi:hypothetical protein